MTRQSSTLSWPPAPADVESAQRDDVVQLGIWMFLATVVMLFAAFTSAFIVRRSASDWRPIELPSILWANTAVLVASSVVLEAGRAARRRHRAAAARRGLLAATGLGLLFLAGQVMALLALVAQGVLVPTTPHSSFFYILTGAHGLHVVAGLILLACAAVHVGNGRAQGDGGASARLANTSATFWHFLAGLWLCVFALVAIF